MRRSSPRIRFRPRRTFRKARSDACTTAAGQILLLGVGHDANTTIHLAEILGAAPYRVPKHITVIENGRPTRVGYGENDHCCQRFALMDDWLREKNLQAEGKIGNAVARLIHARDIVAVAREHLALDPLVFLHTPDASCEECDAARESVGGRL